MWHDDRLLIAASPAGYFMRETPLVGRQGQSSRLATEFPLAMIYSGERWTYIRGQCNVVKARDCDLPRDAHVGVRAGEHSAEGRQVVRREDGGGPGSASQQ